MPLGAILAGLAPALIQGVSGFLGLKSQQDAYDRMQEYNKPVNQMSRLKEAGLSPWLMYSAGNVGNMSSARPAGDGGIGEAGARGLDDYMSVRNFDKDQKLKDLVLDNYWYGVELNRQKVRGAELKNQVELAKFISDFPEMVDNWEKGLTSSMAKRTMRYKMNEVKMALALETLNKVRESVRGMSSDNAVKAVKAKYAKDYGMVGGDWTQGLGVLKTLGSGLRGIGRAKSVTDPMEKSILKQYRGIKGDEMKRKANRYLFENHLQP